MYFVIIKYSIFWILFLLTERVTKFAYTRAHITQVNAFTLLKSGEQKEKKYTVERSNSEWWKQRKILKKRKI